MGSFFMSFFSRQGFEVIVSDIGTKIANEELVKKSDAILFSVPISKTVEVVDSIIKFTRKEQILMDLTSIKTPAVNAMLKSKCEVLGLHPVFGPTVDLKNQIMVVCKARERERTKLFLKLFEKSGMKLKYSTTEKHDKIMAAVQGMTHLNSIALGHALMQLDNPLEETLEFSSPIYKMRLAMVGRILAQDPRLYADIAIENPFMEEALKEIEKSNNELIKLIRKKDKKGFEKYFRDAAGYLDDFKKDSMKITDKMIKAMNDG